MQAPNAPSVSERRTQARLRAQVPIQVRCPGEAKARTVILEDLSWGGALCQAPTELPVHDKPLRLILPWKSGETIEIEAILLRQKALDNGRHLCAMRFSRLSLLNQTRLEKLLGLMQARGSGDSASEELDLVPTLEIRIQTTDEWRSALSDIAAGRLSLTTSAYYAPGQSLGIQFNDVPIRARLRLRARVMAGESIPTHGLETADPYLLTLEFEHPLAALRGWSEWLLGQVSTLGTSGVQRDSSRTAKLAGLRQGHLLVDHRQEQSVLEVEFPEALDYLVTAWGDVDSFLVVFRQLVLGDGDHTKTWTLEAWQELQFLQDVHDLAYGVSADRLNPLRVGRAARQ